MVNSLENPTYDFIGRLAIALYSQGIKISLDALKQILNDKEGNNYSDVSNLGLGQSVAAAYRAWSKIDAVVHHAIAYSYVGKDGKQAWLKE